MAGKLHDIGQQTARLKILEMGKNKMKISGAPCIHAELEDK